jgi:transcriptional regulator with XRE-family HTH domain
MFDARVLGNRVLLGRRELQLDQDELARKSGVSRSRISEIERGKGTNIGIDAVYGLAKALDVTVPYLLGLTEDALGEGTDNVEKELTGDYVIVEIGSKEERRLIQEAIDALIALSPREQRWALQLLRTMRQVEEEEQGSVSPHIVE